MKNLDLIAEELFNKIRGRFPSVTLGDGEGKVTNVPTNARFFDFDYKEGDANLGKVSISLSEKSVEIMYSDSFVSEQDEITKQNWYNFLKEIRQFSKKRLMTFDTRNINKSNLDKRDYKFLAQNRGEETMSESKMYGTNRVSYQKVDGARIVVKHNESINADIAGGRTRSIGKIYIESADGERFMYPFKHLSGARAMARHVAEGGKPFDEFGTHIVGLSEEMNKLRKFKSYMGRSAVMAESLAGYTSVVNDRIKSVKKTIESLQKPNYYAEAFGSFEAAVMEDVPDDVKENWIDQLTIKQFNEELSDVFPYIYKLVSEATKAKELSATDILGEEDGGIFRAGMEVPQDVDGASAGLDKSPRPTARPADLGNTQAADSYVVKPGDTVWSIADRFADSNYDGDTKAGAKDILKLNGIKDPRSLQPGQKLEIGYFMGDMNSGGTRGLPPGGFKSYESQLEDGFDEMMGQFGEEVVSEFQALNSTPIDKTGRVQGTNIFIQRDGTQGSKPDTGYDENDPTMSDKIAAGEKAARGGAPAASKNFQAATSSSGGDLGDGFQSATVDVAGTKGVPAVLDTQSNLYILPNKGYVRSPAKFLTIQNGKMDTAMNVGPATMKALQAAGLLESIKESNEQKTPVTEFVLSMFDRESGQFPKGETAILTAIEKDYGEQYINPAKAFIEAITAKYEELNAGPAIQEIEFDEPTAGTMMEPTIEQDEELDSIRRLSGI
jgi:hypothetical protein